MNRFYQQAPNTIHQQAVVFQQQVQQRPQMQYSIGQQQMVQSIPYQNMGYTGNQYHPQQQPLYYPQYKYQQQHQQAEEDSEEEEEEKTQKKSKDEKKKDSKKKEKKGQNKKRKSGNKRRMATNRQVQQRQVDYGSSNDNDQYYQYYQYQGQREQGQEVEQVVFQGGQKLLKKYKNEQRFYEWLTEKLPDIVSKYEDKQTGEIKGTQLNGIWQEVSSKLGVEQPNSEFVQYLLQQVGLTDQDQLSYEDTELLTNIVFWNYYVEYYYQQQVNAPEEAVQLFKESRRDQDNDDEEFKEISNELFEQYDKDKNGFLDKDEILHLVIDLANELDISRPKESTIQRKIDEFDFNHDHLLSKEEFLKFSTMLFEKMATAGINVDDE